MESLGTRAVVGLGMDAMPPLTLHVVAVAVTSALVTVASVLLAGLAVWGAVGKRVAGEHPGDDGGAVGAARPPATAT